MPDRTPTEQMGAICVAELDRLRAIVYRGLAIKDRRTAEDITHDAVVKALTYLRDRPDAAPGAGLLYTGAQFRLADHHKSRAVRLAAYREPVDAVDIPPARDPADDIAADIDNRRLLAYVLARLSAAHRALLTRLYLDGLTVAEIAAEQNRPASAVKAQRARALARAHEAARRYRAIHAGRA